MRISMVYFLLFLAITTMSRCKNTDNDTLLYGQRNAVWVESTYFRGYRPTTRESLTDKMVIKLAENLKRHHIKYAYLFSGPFDQNGHLPAFAFSPTAIHTVSLLKKTNPELVLLPWVGGIQNATVYLNDSIWVHNAINDTRKLIAYLHVPGVHVDLECVTDTNILVNGKHVKVSKEEIKNYAANVNNFHHLLRLAVPGAFISSVVVATSPDTKPWKRKTTVVELATLIKYVDQLSFLFYDTHINNNDTFNRNCRSLLVDINNLNHQKKIEYLVAIGTFINEPGLQQYRDAQIETIPNTLQAIKSNILSVNNVNKIVSGIALYCNWEAGNEEWNDFLKNWVQ